MLSQLQISNYVIVDSLDLEFDKGMSVLSGETGAGKSILLGALGLTLGDRADSAMVLPDCKRAEISTTFDIDNYKSLQKWLEDNELDNDGECIIRRTISREGRSRGYINGQPVPLTTLKAVGEQLVELHGQHAHHSLLRSDTQRSLLDSFAEHQNDVEAISQIYKEKKSLQQKLEQLITQQQESSEREALLGFQIEELEKLNLSEGEWEQLEHDHSRIANVQTLKQGSYQVQVMIADESDENLLSQLNKAQRELEQLLQLDETLSTSYGMLEEASIQINEAASELRHYIEQLDIDPEQLQYLEERISTTHELARKHRIHPSELPQHLQDLQTRLQEIGNTDEQIDSLNTQLETLNQQYDDLKLKLSSQRKTAAEKLNKEVTTNMRELGIGEGEFSINISECPEGPFGIDEVQYEIKTNPGQPFRPLAKIASGGELSRISLAIQVILATRASIPTLIFDEVDVGIGGKTADMVGRALRRLGNSCQVLCVTHQPQVAAQAHQHYQIIKEHTNESSRTRVVQLDSDARITEIARMSSGMEITEQTLTHAREMIENVQN